MQQEIDHKSYFFDHLCKKLHNRPSSQRLLWSSTTGFFQAGNGKTVKRLSQPNKVSDEDKEQNIHDRVYVPIFTLKHFHQRVENKS